MNSHCDLVLSKTSGMTFIVCGPNPDGT